MRPAASPAARSCFAARTSQSSGRRSASAARRRDVDDLPEPAGGAQSDPRDRPADRGRDPHSQADIDRTPRAPRRWSCCAPCRSAIPRARMNAYPHELSGGMCQRVMIAIAIACDPALLIADEPTTGLDVTTQKMVMDLLADIAAERGMATILITHDLGLGGAILPPRRRDGARPRGRGGQPAGRCSARRSTPIPGGWSRRRRPRPRGSRIS